MEKFLDGFWGVINSATFGEAAAIFTIGCVVLIAAVVFAFSAAYVQGFVSSKM